AKLRALTEIDVQANWLYSELEISENLWEINLADWQLAEQNEKGYLTWDAGQKVRWFGQKFVIPEHLQNYPLTGLSLRLVLTWWAEYVQVFVDGKLVQEGDLWESSVRILLAESVTPGTEFLVTLRLVSPGHDIGALMRSKCVYEAEYLADCLDPGFVADELTVLQKYLTAFEPEKLAIFTKELTRIPWDAVSNKAEFDASLATLRQNLQPLATNIKQRTIKMLTHAHLDMAWLWEVKETWEVAQRTFASVLGLQKDFSGLTFGHSTPALYAWIEENCPDLFEQIREVVEAKRWEILGGMWVEPDVNLVSGESIVRQLFYGQLYFQEKFGEFTQVAWLPDSFGFSWQLPQIFKQCGIEYFVTGKLHWNDTTKFPYGAFWWVSPDGTKILTLMSPPNLTGVMDTNPQPMTDYGIFWEQQTNFQSAFWLPGVGDRGGGPSRDMLEVQERFSTSPFLPRLEFTTATEYLQQLLATTKKETHNCTSVTTTNHQLPVWNDELYLEFHRGCYTTHADQKLFNRRCEDLLYQAELFSSVAALIDREIVYMATSFPIINNSTKAAFLQEVKEKITSAWKQVLFNQFHDILPGTSIPEVFVEANQGWREVEAVATEILTDSLNYLASQIQLPSPPQLEARPIIIFNPLNWERNPVVSLSLPPGRWEVYDLGGEKLASQLTSNQQLLFVAKDIPSIGYRVFWLCEDGELVTGDWGLETGEEYVLENDYLRVVVNSETGDLSSVYDKINSREVLSGAGNQLQGFGDRGQYWDAWNIDPNYEQHPLPPTTLKSIQWRDRGKIRQRLQVIRTLGDSEFCQDYLLEVNSPILKIATTVDWRETHVLVKAAFPLNLESDYVSYEIPCATIKRPTKPQTPAEKAKWEVPALHWADLSDDNYGVSLLNDCKYGYDSKPNQLRLTLLRSSTWPNPESDRGIHHFTYALYPHANSWQSAQTVRKGYELNLPVKVLLWEQINPGENTQTSLPAVATLLDLSAENLILMALKPAADDSEDLILRCYECHGETAELALKGELELARSSQVDFLERPLTFINENSFALRPWQIANFVVRKKKA
ncbi:MAG: alpha-mannosidase, partial [Oscillatoria sp. PMC 1076.18]|nr:alpha-mannosidase [Oscillatoria sp. PMC 1076.18]